MTEVREIDKNTNPNNYKYRFSEKYNFWNEDHLENFNRLKNIYYFQKGLRFLEIGVFEGRSTVWILDNLLRGEDCSLLCIDPDITENGRYNLNFHNRVLLREDFSKNILPELYLDGNRYDFINVDGDHNAPALLLDLVLSWKILKIGGILLIDDYEMETLDPWLYESNPLFKNNPRLNFTHPRFAIDAFVSIYRGQYDMLINNYQIGLMKSLEIF